MRTLALDRLADEGGLFTDYRLCFRKSPVHFDAPERGIDTQEANFFGSCFGGAWVKNCVFLDRDFAGHI
jgi:hypothetical protein